MRLRERDPRLIILVTVALHLTKFKATEDTLILLGHTVGRTTLVRIALAYKYSYLNACISKASTVREGGLNRHPARV